jgi:hypothetical protein
MTNINPYIISDESALGRKLIPLPKNSTEFQEDWLQRLIHNYPDILPLDYINEDYAPPISLGREIMGIDNLLISPSGLITIVETKLWRNPESHRTIVAQILDYAKTLAKWSYKDLDHAVSSYLGKTEKTPISLYQNVKKAFSSINTDEIEFQARVQDCLSNGKFALVIVGDRIYPEATQLAEIIQPAPHMQFSLAFIELRCFKLEKDNNWPLVVVPNFIAKTKELTRAVVKVIYEERKPEIQVEGVEIDNSSPSERTNYSTFINSLPGKYRDIYRMYLDKWLKNPGYIIYWGKLGFSVRLKWKGRIQSICYGYPNFIFIIAEEHVQKWGIPESIYQQYKDELMKSSISHLLLQRKRVSYEGIP